MVLLYQDSYMKLPVKYQIDLVFFFVFSKMMRIEPSEIPITPQDIAVSFLLFVDMIRN